MVTTTGDSTREFVIKIPIKLHPGSRIMSLANVEEMLNSDPSTQQRLRDAIELSLNLTLPEVKPGEKYPEGAFEMGHVTITPTKELRRVVRVKDFVAESLHNIASHSSDGETLHRVADSVAASSDQATVTIVEANAPETERSVYEKRGIVYL